MDLNSTLCPLPWIHVSTTANGKYRTCCLAEHPEMKDKAGQAMRVKTHSFSQALNSNINKEIRSKMLLGERPSACNHCYKIEDLGGVSPRQHKLRQHNFNYKIALEIEERKKTHSMNLSFPTHLDIRLGNGCNLKCIMCDPMNSNQWYDDYTALHGPYQLDRSEFLWTDEDSVGWQELRQNISSIEEIYFTGGEPLINSKHIELLEEIASQKRSYKVSLVYHSNLSMKISERLFTVWKSFKKVQIGVSLDATGAALEYSRYPAKWDLVQKNIQRLRGENIEYWLSPTVSILNAFYLIDLLSWAADQKIEANRIILNTLSHPKYLNIQVLPLSQKFFLREKYNEFILQHPKFKDSITYVIDYMFSQNLEVLLSEFIEKSDALDRARNTSLKNSLPQLHSALNEFSHLSQ